MSKSNKSKQEKESLIEKKEEKPANSSQPAQAANNSNSAKKSTEAKDKTPTRFDQLKYYVFDPAEGIYYKWLIIISIAVLYNYIFIVGRGSFDLLQKINPTLWLVLDCLSDFIYLIDIFVRLRTGYLEQGLLLRDCKKLAINYVKSIQFKLDIFALIPFELGSLFFHEYMPGFRFNRLIKLNRLFECRLKIETRSNHPFLLRIVYLILLILIVIHWNGCFYFLLSREIGIGSDGWVFNYHEKNISNADLLLHEYMFCFFWSTLMLTTIGEVNSPENTFETTIMSLNFLVAIVIFATLVGNIGSVIANMSIQKNNFQHRVDSIKSLMKLRKVSDELFKRVVKWFDYLLKSDQTVDDKEILANLPEKLAIEICSYVNLEKLKSINIFSDCEDGLLRELVTKLKVQVYSPGDFVCKKGDIGNEMYIIKNGSLNVVSDDDKIVFVTLKAGAYFGEISILNIAGNINGNRRTANVRSVGYSELLCLTKNDLWNALAEYPMNKLMIMEKGKAKLRKDNLLDESKQTKKLTLFDSFAGFKMERDLEEFIELNSDQKLTKLISSYNNINDKLEEVIKKFNDECEVTRKKVERYLEQGVLVKDLRQLMKISVSRKRFFIIDLACLLPTDLLYFLLKNNQFWPFIRLNRLLKLNRVLEFRAQTETSTNYPYVFRILSIFIVITIVIHWNACLFFIISKTTGGFNYERYYVDDKFNSEFFPAQYAKCFYRSTLQLTTISNVDPPNNSLEKLYMVINYMIGVIVFAIIVGSITEIIDDLNMKRSEFQKKVDSIKNYMILANVDKEIQKRVINWFNHSWINTNGLDERAIFQESLPENLQVEIAINVHLETLKRVHIFQDCEPGLLRELVTKLQLQVFSPSDFICKKGDIGREMYFIKSGKLNVVSDDGNTVFATLTEGTYFGEISILDIPGNKTGNRRTANVKSVGFSDLFCLTKADLWKALDEFPLARKTLIEKGKSLLRKDNLLNEEMANEIEEQERINEMDDKSLNIYKYRMGDIEKKITKLADTIKSRSDLLQTRLARLETKLNQI